MYVVCTYVPSTYVCMLKLSLTVTCRSGFFSFCFRVYNTSEYSVPLHYTSNIAISSCKRKCVIMYMVRSCYRLVMERILIKPFKIRFYVYCLVHGSSSLQNEQHHVLDIIRVCTQILELCTVNPCCACVCPFWIQWQSFTK